MKPCGRWLDAEPLDGLTGEPRDQLDPILDACVAEYVELPEEDDQVRFKGDAKAFLRTYNFLSTVLPYGSPEWEKRSIFLDHLVPKLPAPICTAEAPASMNSATSVPLETPPTPITGISTARETS